MRWFASFGAFNILSTVVPAVQELHASHADMATVVEGFFNGTFSAKGIERDRLVVWHIPSSSSSYLPSRPLTVHLIDEQRNVLLVCLFRANKVTV